MTVLVTGSRGRVATTLLGLLHDAGVKAKAASKNPADLSPPEGVDTVRTRARPSRAPADRPTRSVGPRALPSGP